PAFCFTAPRAGTGKTLLAQCILQLSGMEPNAIPQTKNEEELRKRFLAALRQGKPGILFDNIRGAVESASVEAFLTTRTFTDRPLRHSRMLTLPTNIMFLMTGNHFQPAGDLWRRLLTIRLDAKTDTPERRIFELEPLEHCRVHRQEIIAAGLALLRGFISAGKPRSTHDKLGTFERWDDLIRQCVIWIGKEGIADVVDPTLHQARPDTPDLGQHTVPLARGRITGRAVIDRRTIHVADVLAE